MQPESYGVKPALLPIDIHDFLESKGIQSCANVGLTFDIEDEIIIGRIAVSSAHLTLFICPS
jgi:hypothetical protein